MEKNPIPTGIEVNDNFYRFSEIYSIAEASIYGETLIGRTRWDRYKNNFLRNDEWEGYFGPDVNNMRHMRLVSGQSGLFLAYCQNPPPEWNQSLSDEAVFTPEEQLKIRLYAPVHDIAEAVTGDIMHDVKTEHDRETEAQVFHKVVLHIFDENQYGDLASMIIGVMEEAEDKESKIGKAFNAIERVGFQITGLRAWRHSKVVESEELRDNLHWMAGNASANQIPKLLDYSHIYPPVFKFVNHHQDLISEVFDQVPYSIFEHYTDPVERGKQEQKFFNAKELWQNRQ